MSLLHRFLATGAPLALPPYSDDAFLAYNYTGTGAYFVQNTSSVLKSTASWNFAKFKETGSGYATDCRTVAVDSTNNVYVGVNESSARLFKYSAAGVVQWKLDFFDTVGGRSLNQISGVTVDSSDNVYIAGRATEFPTNYAVGFVVKLNSSGTIQWQRKLSYGGLFLGLAGIRVDSSNNVFVNGSYGGHAFVVKYNSSGTLQWQRKLVDSGGASTSYNGGTLSVDASGNVCIAGDFPNPSNATFVAKYNSSGTLQWQRKLQNASNPSSGYALTTDSSSNLYVAGSFSDGSSSYAFVAKYNSSGTLQWQRKLIQTTTGTAALGVSADSSGNVYISGQASENFEGLAFVAKYNSSGTLQWQVRMRQYSTGSVTGTGWAVVPDFSGNLLCSGNTYDDTTALYGYVIKIPQDGSGLSGLANSFQLSVGTLAESSGTLTDSAGSLTDSADTLTDSAGALTSSTNTNITYTYSTQPAVTTVGGLVWVKSRGATTDHALYDTGRGAQADLVSNSTAAQTTQNTGLISFEANGFTLGSLAKVNNNATTFEGWVFLEGNNYFSTKTKAHTNGGTSTVNFPTISTPGMIVVKNADNVANWFVWHRGVSAGSLLYLNLTSASSVDSSISVSGTTLTLSSALPTGNYAIYVWAHEVSSSGISQAGTFTTDGSGNATVNLGWEPQFVLYRPSSSISNWFIVDSSRGMLASGYDNRLFANTASAEDTGFGGIAPTANGFNGLGLSGAGLGNSLTYIYLAIRRPNKPPTLGTQVYNAIARTGTGVAATLSGLGFAPDAVIPCRRDASYKTFGSRLQGNEALIQTNLSNAEITGIQSPLWDSPNGTLGVGADTGAMNGSGVNYINYFIKRAPGVSDLVCYGGTGTATTQAHNLGVVPELMIVKGRSGATAWACYSANLANTEYLVLNTTAAKATGATYWNSTAPTSSVFSIGTAAEVNTSAATYVACLFATKAGISKVGSYTGNGSSQTINCGFTTGARFILIKRTDSTGDWCVWDSTRGIVAGNDPHISLNDTSAEVITDDSVDADTSGFIVNQLAATNINVTSATYIYLSLA